MSKIIGRKPHQVPTNNDLGEMAYQSKNIYVDNINIGGVSHLETTIKSWNPTHWYDYTDLRYSESNFIYSKGQYAHRMTGTDYTSIYINNKRFWTGSSSAGRFYIQTSWGVNSSYFFVSAYTPYTIKEGGISGAYWADGALNARVSVSTDSFGNNIDVGEISHHAGTSSGYDVGSSTLIGGRLGTNNTRDDKPVIHAVAGHFANWNDGFGGESVRLCTLNTGTLRENLFNNGTNCGSNTSSEIYWGNRHSSDRAIQNKRNYAEMIIFNNYRLNEDQYAFLEHYFKIKYGGTDGRSI